jgi:hypothetical protein
MRANAMQYGKLNTSPTTYSFDFIVDLIMADQIDKLWDLELDVKVAFRSIERFQRFDYFNACAKSEVSLITSLGMIAVSAVTPNGYRVRAVHK